MIRFIVVLVLLLLAPPQVGASTAAPDVANEPDRFAASDPGFEFGAIRSGSGWELLLGLEGRSHLRTSGTDARSFRRDRAGVLPSDQDLLALRSSRYIRAREADLRRADAPHAVHEPCRANPPPDVVVLSLIP